MFAIRLRLWVSASANAAELAAGDRRYTSTASVVAANVSFRRPNSDKMLPRLFNDRARSDSNAAGGGHC